MYTKGGLLVEIKERKLRKVGNSVVMTLSKEFLESIGATATDTVYVDEEKLKDIIVKKICQNIKKLQQMMENSKQNIMSCTKNWLLNEKYLLFISG